MYGCSKTAAGIMAGSDEFHSHAVYMITAKITVRCTECGRNIPAGEYYEFFHGKKDVKSRWVSYRTCKQCLEMARDFMECRVYGMLRYVVWAEIGVDIVTGAVASEESIPPFEDDPACDWRLDW